MSLLFLSHSPENASPGAFLKEHTLGQGKLNLKKWCPGMLGRVTICPNLWGMKEAMAREQAME